MHLWSTEFSGVDLLLRMQVQQGSSPLRPGTFHFLLMIGSLNPMSAPIVGSKTSRRPSPSTSTMSSFPTPFFLAVRWPSQSMEKPRGIWTRGKWICCAYVWKYQKTEAIRSTGRMHWYRWTTTASPSMNRKYVWKGRIWLAIANLWRYYRENWFKQCSPCHAVHKESFRMRVPGAL